MINPLHGEIWWVNLDPTVGQEIQKERPYVVISGAGINNLEIRVAIPITGWNESTMARRPWFVRIAPEADNGIQKDSAAACHHIRSLSLARFVRRAGRLSDSDLADVKAGIVLSLELPVGGSLG